MKGPAFTASCLALGALALAGADWYRESFFLLHEDHHTSGKVEVGRDANPEETSRLVGMAGPDVVQIHAKGNPGWTTYPSKIGHTPPALARDVLAIWRDVAERDGYPFSVYYNIGRDGEIMTRRPRWNRMYPDGRPVDRALCYHSGVAEGYLWPMIREIMDGYRPKGFWFDGSCFTIRPCYCEKCRERFSAEEGSAAPEKPGDPAWAKYQEMQRQIYREFIRETCQRIHAVDPDCLVAFNWAYSIRMPEEPDPGIAYLTGDIGNRVEGLSAEAHWLDSTGMPFDLMTQICTLQTPADGGGPPAMRPKPDCQIEQEMAVILANGGRFNAWDNPTPESGLVPERFQFMARVVAPFLRDRQSWCVGTERVADVSLLHSAAVHYAVTETSAPSFHKSNNRIDGAAKRLARLHLNYEMLPDWRLEAGRVGSSLIVVEHPRGLAKETAEQLVEFVRSGGSVLMTGMGIGQNRRLTELFGVGVSAAPGGPERLVTQFEGAEYPFEHWLFRVDLQGSESLIGVESSDGKSWPLLTRHKFGLGQAFYVPFPLLSDHGEQEVPPAVLREVFARVLPEEDRQLCVDLPENVEVVLRRRGEQRIVHLVNMAPGQREVFKSVRRSYPLVKSLPEVPESTVSIRMANRPSSVRLQPGDRLLADWRHVNDWLEVQVPPFAVHQMVVIEP